MSAFKALRDVSINFEEEIRRVSKELFSTKIGDNFESAITKKIRDLTFFTSKIRFLEAKTLSEIPEVTEEHKDESLQSLNYGEAVLWKIMEQQTVKTMMQSHAIKNLIMTSNRNLEPEMLSRKENIMHHLNIYRVKESKLRQYDSVLNEKEIEYDATKKEWDVVLSELRQAKCEVQEESEEEMTPLKIKLKKLIAKLELMRCLISKLATSRAGPYDWLTDPHNRLQALQNSRNANTIDSFLESS